MMVRNKIVEFVKKRWFLFILLLFLVISISLLNPDLQVFDFNSDSSFYLILARSISAGQGYNDLYYPGNPPNVEFPFLYPFFLAVVLKVFTQNYIVALKLLSVLFGAVSLVTIYILFSIKFKAQDIKFAISASLPISYNSILIIILFTCTNLWFLSFSTLISPEIVYLFFSIMTLLLLKKYEQSNNIFNKYMFLSCFMLAISFFTKLIGFSLALTVFIYFFIIKKRYKKGFFLIVSFFILVLPWIIRERLVVDNSVSMSCLNQFILGHRMSIMNIARAIPGNIIFCYRGMSSFMASGYFYPLFSKIGEGYFLSLYEQINGVNSFVPHSLISFYGIGEIFIFIIILLGFIYGNQRDEDNLVNIYVLCYLGIIFILPPCLCMKIGNRIFLPLLPFIIYYFLNGLLLIILGLSQFMNVQFFKKKGWLLIAGLGLLFVGNLLFIVRLGMANINYLSNYEQLSGRAEEKHSLFWYMEQLSINDWVREKTFVDDVFMCSNPALFYLNTNRKAVYFEKEPYCPNFKRDPEEIEFIIKDKKINYIIADNEEQDEIIREFNCLKESRLILVPLITFQSLEQKSVKIYKVIENDLQFKKLNAQGVYWFKGKNLQKAIVSLKRAIEVDPNFVGYFNLGSCYEKKGLVADALKYYKKAINLQPNYEIAINRLNFLRQKEVVKNKPNNSKEYLLLGKLYLKNYNYFGAIISFKRAIQLDSRLWLGYYNLGLVYTCVQKYDLAVLQIEKAIKMNPDLQDKATCLFEFIKKQKNREL